MEKFDICIIGAGPAGYAAAMRALDFGKRVVLIERDKLGGAGIHQGALWSKTWWEISREARMINTHKSVLSLKEPVFSYKKINQEVTSAVEHRVGLLSQHLNDINQSLNKDIFKYMQGTAMVIGKNHVSVSNNGTKSAIEADYIILATGSKPRKLPQWPIDEETVFTSDGLGNLKDFPKSIVIIGAGVIGCEFATIFSNFGQTKVHLIDKGDRILPFEDKDVVRIIEKNLEEKGVLIHRNSKLTNIEIRKGKVKYELEYADGSTENFEVEKALVSIGRVPQYDHLIDDSLDLEMDAGGIVDDLTQTSVSNIYAVGDITADISLVNVGELEGRYAVECIFGKPEQPLIYNNISTIMFLDPEIAGVGMNETQAKAAGLDYKMVSLNYETIPRATAMRNTQGFIKILVANDEDMHILGMRVVGEHASSAIQAVALLISQGKSIKELAELIHPHPSIIEGIQECGRVLMGKPLLKPRVMKEAIKCQVWQNNEYRDLVHI
ncbi:MAG: NAD(P)/FAD-dependent oxidoreductase [Ekhidna sp.]|nr:NAD(P)/FAD-dependent oxidoreductase [Ekhidna sp.]MBC6409806.1 NAD(P)/FAD-dependent oxidoreductase [Ekhidna sp.]MBC6425186.1 NAD(P)/FAD-dependent oxidoreductase [Ekhidna sp.]